jgi:hypothetical protein
LPPEVVVFGELYTVSPAIKFAVTLPDWGRPSSILVSMLKACFTDMLAEEYELPKYNPVTSDRPKKLAPF